MTSEEILRIEIPDIEPLPWPRTRSTGGRYYLPRSYVAYRDLVAMHLRAAMRNHPPEVGPLFLVLGFYRSTKRRADVDNLAKSVLDAGNGVAWEDDSQILDLLAQIRYRKLPSIEILAYRLDLDARGDVSSAASEPEEPAEGS